jgi:hypothetical protein
MTRQKVTINCPHARSGMTRGSTCSPPRTLYAHVARLTRPLLDRRDPETKRTGSGNGRARLAKKMGRSDVQNLPPIPDDLRDRDSEN